MTRATMRAIRQDAFGGPEVLELVEVERPEPDLSQVLVKAFARKPASIDHVQAGVLPLAALTAWPSLVDTADVQPGQRVLIHAAAGGVGHLTVQIAKARGAYVIGTASEGNHELLRSLGADELIDYRTTDFETVVEDVDVVLDAHNGDYPARSLGVLHRGGVLISLLPFPPEVAAEGHKAGETGHVAGKLVLRVVP
jgi:NADPH:quinone reductase-like Zn-dependent oxidoreductase